MSLAIPTIMSNFLNYSFIFIFCLVGAIIKDSYNTLTEKDAKIKVSRILISTLVSSILLFSLSDYLLNIMNWKLFILPCFGGGMIGFELMGKISHLSFWIKAVANKEKILEELSKDNKHDNDNIE